MKNIVLFIFIAFFTSCSSFHKSELLGVWKSNEQMTLNSINYKEDFPKKISELIENDFFGHMIHEYKRTEARGYTDNCEEMCKEMKCKEKCIKYCNESKNFTAYTLIEETPEYFLVESYDDFLKENTQHYLYRENNCYYIMFSEKWDLKEYFCKQ